MKRQRFSREYKLEAVKQVRERNVLSAQVARDLGIRENLVSRWVREAGGDTRKAFPGQGQQPAEQAEIERLKREIVKVLAAGLAHSPSVCSVPSACADRNGLLQRRLATPGGVKRFLQENEKLCRQIDQETRKKLGLPVAAPAAPAAAAGAVAKSAERPSGLQAPAAPRPAAPARVDTAKKQ